MERKETRRAQMTKLLLKTALIELMQEKPFKQITIKELCERADLNRTTFYLHYADQQGVLNDVEREVRKKTAEYMEKISPAAEAVELIEAFLSYVQKNDAIFRTLLLQGGGDGFELAFINYTLRVLKPNLPNYGDPARERYVLTFLMYGSVHIIIDWIESNYDLTAREIAKLIFDLCDSVKA